MRTIFILTLLIVSNLSFGQTAIGNSEGTQTLIDLKDNFATYVGLQPKSKGVIGTPFLFDDLKKARISMIKGNVYENVLVNILPDQSQLYVQVKENNIVIPETSYIESVLFLEDSALYMPLEYNKKKEFFRLLLETEEKKYMSLSGKKFIKATVGGAYNSGSKFDEYQEVISYFYQIDSELIEIKKSNSGIKSLAGENWNLAKDFIKQNKIDFNNPMDMTKLFLYLESL